MRFFLATDSGRRVVMVLLDLKAAVDAVDHQILLPLLENWVGIKGRALGERRSFCVRVGTFESFVAVLTCGVRQGSILGPLLFSLSLSQKFGMPFHFYAADRQIYMYLKRGEGVSANQLALKHYKNESTDVS